MVKEGSPRGMKKGSQASFLTARCLEVAKLRLEAQAEVASPSPSKDKRSVQAEKPVVAQMTWPLAAPVCLWSFGRPPMGSRSTALPGRDHFAKMTQFRGLAPMQLSTGLGLLEAAVPLPNEEPRQGHDTSEILHTTDTEKLRLVFRQALRQAKLSQAELHTAEQTVSALKAALRTAQWRESGQSSAKRLPWTSSASSWSVAASQRTAATSMGEEVVRLRTWKEQLKDSEHRLQSEVQDVLRQIRRLRAELQARELRRVRRSESPRSAKSQAAMPKLVPSLPLGKVQVQANLFNLNRFYRGPKPSEHLLLKAQETKELVELPRI